MTKLKGFKFVTELPLEFKKIEIDDKINYKHLLFVLKSRKIIIENDIDDVFESICSTIISNIKKYLGKGSGCITDSVLNHNINISKYKALAGNSCIKLKKVRVYSKNW